MIELDRFKSAPPSYVTDYAYIFAGGKTELAQMHGSYLLRLSRSLDYVDGMPHTTWRLYARIPTGDAVADWLGPIICVTHVDGHEMVYLEDDIDPRIPAAYTINPQALLVDVLLERSFRGPELHSIWDFDSEDC